MDESPKAKGGLARAKSLTPEERRSIASKAASARWKSDVPVAICGSPDQPLRIGDIELQCYVLEDQTRVLSQGGFLEALGRHKKASVRSEEGEEQVPPILQGQAIKPFLTQEILEKSTTVAFRTPTGLPARGYRAELLPMVCEVYLKAREAGVLRHQQKHVARQAEIVIRGLAQVGIIALIDEATGYQEIRARDALAKVLEAFIAKELQPWVQTFPGDYYKELFRLRGLTYPITSVRRPQYFGVLTNDIIYKRLAPGVLAELKRVTLRSQSGRRKHKYFQRLTNNIGYPKLREHLGAVVAVMKLSNSYHDFLEKLNRLCPRYGDQFLLPFDYDGEKDDGRGL